MSLKWKQKKKLKRNKKFGSPKKQQYELAKSEKKQMSEVQ